MMIAPRLLPDEWAIGYWGRVLLINGVDPSVSNFVSLGFANQFRNERGIEAKCIERDLAVMSAAAQISMHQLLRGHTLVPFNKAVSGAVDADWLDEQHRFRPHGSGIAMGDRMKFGALCPQCVDEDRVFWGFSYWRRSHQVHGTVLCEKHGCALRYANKRLLCQLLPDHADVRPTTQEEHALAQEAAQNKWVRRYAEVALELLDRPRPLSRLQLLHALTRRARLMGVTPAGTGSGPTLRDLAKRCFPTVWMRRFVAPSLLDDVLTRFNLVASTPDYLLAITLLYESTDQAFRDIERPLPTLAMLDKKIRDAFAGYARSQPWMRQEAKARRQLLTAAIGALLGGQEFRECARAAVCYPIVFEDFVIQLFSDTAPVPQRRRAPSRDLSHVSA